MTNSEIYTIAFRVLESAEDAGETSFAGAAESVCISIRTGTAINPRYLEMTMEAAREVLDMDV